VKPQPPPSLLLGLEPVHSCLGVARVMSEQKVPRSVEQRIVIKFLVGENGDILSHTVVGVCGEFQRTGRFIQDYHQKKYSHHQTKYIGKELGSIFNIQISSTRCLVCTFRSLKDSYIRALWVLTVKPYIFKLESCVKKWCNIRAA